MYNINNHAGFHVFLFSNDLSLIRNVMSPSRNKVCTEHRVCCFEIILMKAATAADYI